MLLRCADNANTAGPRSQGQGPMPAIVEVQAGWQTSPICSFAWSIVLVGLRNCLGATQGQPVLLVSETDGHQQRSKSEETEDAITLAQVAGVIEKRLADRKGEQNNRLPTKKRRSLPETHSQQTRSIQHEKRRDRERLLEVSLGIAVGLPPGCL